MDTKLSQDIFFYISTSEEVSSELLQAFPRGGGSSTEGAREPHRERDVNCHVTLASLQSALLVSGIPTNQRTE